MLESNGLEILTFLLQELVIATFLKLDIHCGFLQVILTPKDTKLLNEGIQEGKRALSQEVCCSAWGGPGNDLGQREGGLSVSVGGGVWGSHLAVSILLPLSSSSH